MKTMMKWNTQWVAMSIKEYEIVFQEAIEQCIKDNGLPEVPWWEVTGHEEQIFSNVLEICTTEYVDPLDEFFELVNYYIKLSCITYKYIEDRMVYKDASR